MFRQAVILVSLKVFFLPKKVKALKLTVMFLLQLRSFSRGQKTVNLVDFSMEFFVLKIVDSK